MSNPDPEPCGHKLADRDLPNYCTVVTCRNYIARSDMWNAMNGWRYVGPTMDTGEPRQDQRTN